MRPTSAENLPGVKSGHQLKRKSLADSFYYFPISQEKGLRTGDHHGVEGAVIIFAITPMKLECLSYLKADS